VIKPFTCISYVKSGVQTGFYGKIAFKASCLVTLEGADWRKPMGEKAKELLNEASIV
jgi:hypothetical protein